MAYTTLRFVVLIALFSCITIAANDGLNSAYQSYKHQRSVKTTAAQSIRRGEYEWRRFTIPIPMFSKLNESYSDMRIIGISDAGDTIEAPYLLQRMDTDTSVRESNCQILNESSIGDVRYFTIRTPSALRTTNRLHVDIDGDEFDYRATLEGSHDGRIWYNLKDSCRVLALRYDGASYRYTDINYPATDYSMFRLAIVSKQRVPLRGATVLQYTGKRAEYHNEYVRFIQSTYDKTRRATILRAELPYAVPVSSITLFVRNSFDYFRRCSIEMLTDSVKTSKGWFENYTLLADGIINSYETPSLHFPMRIARTFRITIDDGNNQPLILDSALFQTPEHHVLMRLERHRTYTLLYGNQYAELPDYDIVHFADKIPQVVEAVDLGDEQQRTATGDVSAQPLLTNKWWLWAVVVLVVTIVGYFTYGMMKKA